MKHILTAEVPFRVQGSGFIIALFLVFSFAHSSETRAQSSSQKSPTITFHFSDDSLGNTFGTSSDETLGKSSDQPLGVECACILNANLTQISNCSEPITHPVGKGQILQNNNPCCCVDLQISFECTGTSLCGFHVGFDDGNFDPLCSFCLTPRGWTVTQNPDGSLDIDFSGTDCSGSLGNGAPPIDFQFCGFNTPGQVGYTVTAFVCEQGGVAGSLCIPGAEWCSRHFESTINCGTGPDAVTTTNTPFSVKAGFPNPASSSIRFDYSAPIGGLMALTIVDILGKTVSTLSHTIAQGDGNVTIDLTGAQPGGYYSVFEFNGERITKRIEVR